MKTTAKALLLLVVTLCSCRHGKPLRPHSGGEPYEVVVVTTDNALRNALDSLLTTDVPGLPQSEPLFNLSHSETGRLTQATRYARNIIMLERDTNANRPTVTYSRDRYAAPQLIVSVKTPTAEGLKTVGKRLVAMLERHELQALTATLNGHRNTEAERRIAETLGWRITVPQELTAAKWGQRFVWLSDNGRLTMSNLCVYTYSGTATDAVTLADKRDSVMALNIPGETAAMRMKTERSVPLTMERDAHGLTCRGLWQMVNDAMGGPFVCRIMIDSVKQCVVVAEGFVYAPGRKKRDKLKRLEAAINTLKK